MESVCDDVNESITKTGSQIDNATKENPIDNGISSQRAIKQSSYASTLSKNLNGKGNRLFTVPTGFNCNGEEVVLFDEDLVREGSEKCAISSRLGKPVMMDQMTFEMCNMGTGRLGYERVLVELDASKNFIDKGKINNVDDKKNVKMSKWVKVEYSWKPDRCGHYNVLGHGINQCKAKPSVSNENEKRGIKNVNNMAGSKEEFIEVRNMKKKHEEYMPDLKPVAAEVNISSSTGKDQGTSGSPRSERSWKISKENVEELKRSTNKYSVLAEDNNLVEAMERNDKDLSGGEDVYESVNQAVNNVIVDEVLGSVDKGINA
nr:hypothetical protein [Tanacetum cinerariifolium]